MSTLRTDLDGLVFGAKGAVTPKVIAEAAALVQAAGTSGETLEAFRDAFDEFRARGYLDTKSRAALDIAYGKLVEALPIAEPSGGTVEALGTKLSEVKALVGSRKAEVSALESKLSVTESQILTKTAQVSNLISQKQQYQQTLRQKERDRETLLIFAIFGAFGAASTAVGLGSAMSLSQLQQTISQLDHEIAATQQQKLSLESSLAHYRSEQRTKKRELDALKEVETTLSASFEDGDIPEDLEGPQRVAALRTRIHDGQALAENLRKQIELLKNMNGSASAMSGQLTGLIGALQQDLKVLEQRIATSEKALLGVVIDLAFAAGGVSSKIQLGPFSIAKKTILLEGLPGVRLAIDRQIPKLLEKMIADNLIDAGTAPEIAKMIAWALGRPEADPRKSAAVSSMSDVKFGALSDAQRLVIDSIVAYREPDDAREALIASAADAAKINDAQARAAAAIALTDEGPADGQKQAFDAVLSNDKLTKAEAAAAVIDYGLSTTYGESDTGEDMFFAFHRLQRLARRALSFFPPTAPVARVIADGLSVLDDAPGTPVEDHALMRATLLAARSVAKKPDATPKQIALEVLRGYRAATEHRTGEGADERRVLDAERAIAAMKRLMPDDPAIQAVETAGSDLAALTARLAELEAALT